MEPHCLRAGNKKSVILLCPAQSAQLLLRCRGSMVFDPFDRFTPQDFVFKIARTPQEMEGFWALRRAIFCEEQKVFHGSDRDEFDQFAIPIICETLVIAFDFVLGSAKVDHSNRVSGSSRACAGDPSWRRLRGDPGWRWLVALCGGRDDYCWIELPIFDGKGYPGHHRGITRTPGLYFLGLPWQYTWGSGRFSGIARDAEFLVEQIEAVRDYKPRMNGFALNEWALGS
jgi:hypothetical protein